MKKRILAFILSALLLAGTAGVAAEESKSVTAVDGAVTVSCTVEAAEGTPVLMFIVPAIIENNIDVTADKIQGLTSKDILDTLDVEYAAAVKTGANGLVEHNCLMKDSLQTGLCHVIFSFLGSDGCYSAGTFEHVGKDDVNNLVKAFNDSAQDGYVAIIDEDVNGKDGETAKEILKKSSADTAYYSSLADKAEFADLLFGLKPETGFDILNLVSAFNEAKAWIRLRTENDTLAVLSAYNGEASGKYWNIPIDEGSDFAELSDSEKEKLLSGIKTAKYEENTTLHEAFSEGVALACFRETDTREDLESLIAEDGAYSSYFEEIRKIIEDEDLNKYEIAELYNNVLESNSECESFDSIKELLEDSVPEEESSKSSGGGGGGKSVGASSGYKSSVSGGSSAATGNQTNTPANTATPFSDVSSEHWASSYIERLYKEGAVNGVDKENFAPQGTVLRQDFVKILIGALNIALSENKSIFDDVESGSYYEAYVMTAFEKGLISGIEAGSFGTNRSIRREDAAVIMGRVLDAYNVEITGKANEFADKDTIADYAMASVTKVAAAGIFGGDDEGNFNAKGELSRAEACAILCRLADIIKGV